MINLLQPIVCGSADISAAKSINNSYILKQNLQKNEIIKSEKFQETMKIEQISSGDQIAFIKIQDGLSSPSPLKPPKFQRQTQFQKFFMQYYPDFFHQYCMCMHTKVEPDDLITATNHTDDHYNEKYAANSFLLSHTSIIPITVVPKKFEYVNQMKSPILDDRRLQTADLNRRNVQQYEFEKMQIENGDVNNRSQNVCPIKSAQSVHSKQEDTNVNVKPDVDSDDDDVSIGISLGKKSPISRSSNATTRSIHDANSPAFDNRSKSAYSIEQSSNEAINETVKLNAPCPENGDGEAIDTSLEHIQNENNEKLMAEESKDENVDSATIEDSDTIDSAEKTEEILIETQPEHLLDAAYMSIQKPCEGDENEPHSETDSISLTSTEESSDYPTTRDSAVKAIAMCEQSKVSSGKPVPKRRTAIPSLRNRVVPAPKSSPLTTTPKSKTVEMFPQTLRKFDKPREASNTCLNQLDSQTWEVTMNGLTTFVRLIRYHPDTVEAHLHAYCVALAKQVKNLRSQVSRSACEASAEFFQTHAKHLETECDDLALQLLNRTADTNKFLRADAFRALASMCDNLTPTKVIHAILTRGATHQNAIVRTTTANLCSRIVSRLGCEKFYSMNRDYRDKLVVAGANFLMEGSLDTRNHAKAFFKQLSAHPQYNRMIQDVIPSRIYRNIEKALRSIK